ncbi:anthranilate synthase / indole-3-glycerol phosphate synthase [Coemansia sp. RSA 989]|nr:bifunctional enzyme exhibiting indole-3-glycerol-phosphate synthase [Coemansia mojavensis]KAJ1739908.1 anthranilate synthase / indole-3-glycerol phosphate synthase [Coemansia sp. RSA 1086]KAJ1748353.1 anthranilate synthase / indole-3-glycerol phosphate synthase [Coemansia sp. RSA 1821]KAJ1861432.1 anthranilate synthase / indole-3-glycerol phosphate synthase [Coemansia sp. RSA 989]KAJ1870342.1 anthranilate synthase / indole-3-glycerol phosphate synthase [Coemansia sp. RSA 990]KAJ2652766.1 an
MATVLLDAYDSFTFNLYQYLSQAGADVHVYRNDKITLDEVIALNPVNIVLSPGPGHPREDPGICYEVLEHFQGRVPILGVCLGQQMMFEHYGGSVGYAGEIHHGKTSTIMHDGQGLYRGIGQQFPITRYHSLAGHPETLPDCLEVNSWTGSGVIMGVRHKEYTVEGVQYHPESILSENGHKMFANFLKLRGGFWRDNEGARVPEDIANHYPGRSLSAKEPAQPLDILSRIFSQRQLDVQEQKAAPGRSLADLQKLLDMGVAPKQIDFAQRLRASSRGELAVLAEIKRASPSKGDICLSAVAAQQALAYAQAGAAAISVLTEPTWFKGSIDDLRDARAALQPLENRPAVLRKEFVFDRYQIAEARLAGADSVLLIVKMLSRKQLRSLMAYSRSLQMEPLVEVNNGEEMQVALEEGARVVGVNNRNLRTFDVDIRVTRDLAAAAPVPESVVLVALSGIVAPQDAAIYKGSLVAAVLVGEALMRAEDKPAFVKALQTALI